MYEKHWELFYKNNIKHLKKTVVKELQGLRQTNSKIHICNYRWIGIIVC